MNCSRKMDGVVSASRTAMDGDLDQAGVFEPPRTARRDSLDFLRVCTILSLSSCTLPGIYLRALPRAPGKIPFGRGTRIDAIRIRNPLLISK